MMILLGHFAVIAVFTGFCLFLDISPLIFFDPISIGLVTLLPTALVLTHTPFLIGYKAFLSIFLPAKSEPELRPAMLAALRSVETNCILTGVIGFLVCRIIFIAKITDDGSYKGMVMAVSYLAPFWGIFTSMLVLRPARIRLERLMRDGE